MKIPIFFNIDSEKKLLGWATLFLLLFSIALTLSPAARADNWGEPLRWSHWLGFITWLAFAIYIHRRIKQLLPDSDPYLFPVAALLCGWGLLTIWRLTPEFGLRQSAWLAISSAILEAWMRKPEWLNLLKKYKYIWLTMGLILTTATFIFGINPGQIGPNLWLGCCGFYLQPSEPLKLLMIVYLAGYFATRIPIRTKIFPLMLPTVLVVALALAILLAQRDLGTASIFIFLYSCMLFFASGYKRILFGSFGGLTLLGLAGYFVVGIIQNRIDSWINPWADPSGKSYQIIQALMAVANGGILGRGPGMGSPGLVPVAHSDFIFTSIVEESGLLGSFAILLLFALLISRGFIIALRATTYYERLLAAGISTYFGIQSILIIGGNIRTLPLTGVTLPFVSYGGSSLVISLLALVFLLIISNNSANEDPKPQINYSPYIIIPSIIQIGLLSLALTSGWWSILRNTDLLNRSDNGRRSIADTYVLRGSLLDRNNKPINITDGPIGEFKRHYEYPKLALTTGYTHPVYGQNGLEASLDNYLRGEDGNPALLVWWERLLYGHHPSGLDVRLTIDLSLQQKADDLLGERAGAIVLLNAQTGEILAIASHPSFNPENLGQSLLHEAEKAPYLNRVTQGLYPFWTVSEPFRAIALNTPLSAPNSQQVRDLFSALGIYRAPEISLETANSFENLSSIDQLASPLQMALAATAISNHGLINFPQLTTAVNTPQSGWVIFENPKNIQSPIFSDEQINKKIKDYLIIQGNFWGHQTKEFSLVAPSSGINIFIGGTQPAWQGTPFTIVVIIESTQSTLEDPSTIDAQAIGLSLLKASSNQ